MRVITSITNQPKQRIVLKLDNNETVIMRLYYYATQKSWYFDIEYKSIRFVNYKERFSEGDIITIKYNPDNQNEIIYLPYEKHRMKTEIRNTIIFFAFLVLYLTSTYFSLFVLMFLFQFYCMVIKE